MPGSRWLPSVVNREPGLWTDAVFAGHWISDLSQKGVSKESMEMLHLKHVS